MNGLLFDTMQRCVNLDGERAVMVIFFDNHVCMNEVLKLVITLTTVVICFMELDGASFCCIRSILALSRYVGYSCNKQFSA